MYYVQVICVVHCAIYIYYRTSGSHMLLLVELSEMLYRVIQLYRYFRNLCASNNFNFNSTFIALNLCQEDRF